jgi:hypothetical protein
LDRLIVEDRGSIADQASQAFSVNHMNAASDACLRNDTLDRA